MVMMAGKGRVVMHLRDVGLLITTGRVVVVVVVVVVVLVVCHCWLTMIAKLQR
jgi:hypothetical protein